MYDTDFPNCCGITCISNLGSYDTAAEIKRNEELAAKNGRCLALIALTDAHNPASGYTFDQVAHFGPILTELGYKRVRRFFAKHSGNHVELWAKHLDSNYKPPTNHYDYNEGKTIKIELPPEEYVEGEYEEYDDEIEDPVAT